MAGRAQGASPWVWADLRAVEPQDLEVRSGDAVEDRRLEEAFREGYRQGRAEGEAEAARSLGSAVAAANRAAEAVAAAQDGMRADLEVNTAALAVAIARELTISELDRAPEAVAELVREAVSTFALDEPLRIRLHPTDLALISGGDEMRVSGSRQVRWEPDPGLGRGGCLVEGPGQIVDGRLDLALERIYRALTDD